MYNKLFTKILDSSIWLEDDATRIVWLTMIAVMDEEGFCQFASIPNVAHRARVSLADAERAIACLESPDDHSSDPDHEGRRIERVPGGWMVLNAIKYRKMVTRAVIREQTRERVTRFRDKKRSGNADSATRNAESAKSNASVTPSEAIAETGADPKAAPSVRATRIAPLIESPLHWDRKHGGHLPGFCDWMCFPSDLAEQFGGRSGWDLGRVTGWAEAVRRNWQASQRVPSGRMYDFWNDRWTEQHPTTKPKAPDWKAEAMRKAAGEGR